MAITSPALYTPSALLEVIFVIVGGVVSMVKLGTESALEAFPTASVTVIVQFEYVPTESVLNVTVLVPELADVVADEHEPPYEIVPTSFVVKE